MVCLKERNWSGNMYCCRLGLLRWSINCREEGIICRPGMARKMTEAHQGRKLTIGSILLIYRFSFEIFGTV